MATAVDFSQLKLFANKHCPGINTGTLGFTQCCLAPAVSMFINNGLHLIFVEFLFRHYLCIYRVDKFHFYDTIEKSCHLYKHQMDKWLINTRI